ncbi:alr3492 [Nostoc sp. PCC 7120 = FACHB-418]|nr:alr3492 [Nostoc sp. PCC 7120 = FACHB-418]
MKLIINCFMNNSVDASILFNDSSPQLLATGITQTLEEYESLLLDLFQELRQAGMALTPEQYELLQIAVEKGYGLAGWEDLKRLCRLLWVKPCANYDINIFNRVFNSYLQQHRAKTLINPEPETLAESPEKTSNSPDSTPSVVEPLSNLPQIPPRNFEKPLSLQPDKVETPSAIKGSSTPPKLKFEQSNFVLNPQDFPINLQDVQRIWRLLKKPVRLGWEDELDIEATVERIEREGFLTDVEMRPRMTRQAELLLLIDDNSAMIPFFLAFEPWMQAIKEARITPARIYRFTSYPDEYLYEWERPTLAHPLINILPKLHRHRTIALIFSDAGAATITYNQDRIDGISKFLIALSPCVRQFIWLNPLPHQRWEYTSAWGINATLNGKMLTYGLASLQIAAKENPQGDTIKIWQINPH